MARESIADLLVRLGLDSAELTKGLKKSSDEIKGFVEHVKNSAESIKHLLEFELVLKGVEKAKQAFEYIAESAEAAERTARMAQSIGMPVEQVQRLGAAAKMTGTAQDMLGTSLAKLSRNMQKADADSGDAAKAFDALGIKATDSTGRLRPAQDVFLDLADKFHGMEDGAGKTALAMMIFGRSGAEMIPLLNRGSAGIQEFGAAAARAGKVLSAETIEGAEKFAQSMKSLQGGAQALGATIAADLSPNLESLVDAFGRGADKAALMKEAASDIANVFRVVAWGGLAVYGTFGVVGRSLATVGALAAAALRRSWTEMKAVIAESDKDTDAFFERVRKMQIALFEPPKHEQKPESGGTKSPPPIIPNLDKTSTAIKAIENEINSLREKAATMGMGDAAAKLWSVQFGNLAEKLKETGGRAGELRDKLVAAILAEGNARDQLKRDQAGEEAWKKIAAEVERSTLELMKNEGATHAARLEWEILNGEIGKSLAAVKASAKGPEDMAAVMGAVGTLRANAATLDYAEGSKALTRSLDELQKKTSLLSRETERSRTEFELSQGSLRKYVDQLGGPASAQGKAFSDALMRQADAFDYARASRAAARMPGFDLFENTEEQTKLQSERLQSFYRQVDAWRQQDLISEQTAAQMKARLEVAQTELRLQHAQSFFGTLARLQSSSSRELAAIGKAAAIAQATIDGILGVQKALATYPPPWSFAMAGAVGAVAAANVAAIVATGFQGGGFTGDGPVDGVAGVVHGQEFVMNAGATSRYRPMLEAMNSGRGSAAVGSAPGSKLVVEVSNESGYPVQFEAMQMTDDRVALIARKVVHAEAPRVVARNMVDRNGDVQKALRRTTTVRSKG